MVKEDYKRIKNPLKKTRIKHYWNKKEYKNLNLALRAVFNANHNQINSTINWTKEEIDNLKHVKAKRKYEERYNRWQ